MYNCQDLKRKRGGRRRRGQLKDHGPDYKNGFTREDGDDIQEMEELGLAGIRPDKVDGHVTSPCSYGSMHGYTWGELFFLFCSFFLV